MPNETIESKRMEFVYVSGSGTEKSVILNVKPEVYSQEETTLSNVVQTKGGAFIETFGAGIMNINIKGSTGYGKGAGYQNFKDLQDLFRSYLKDTTRGTQLQFHNLTDGDAYVVHTDPSGFRYLRSKNNPLLYYYDIKLIALRRVGDPDPEDRDDSTIADTLGSAIPGSPVNPTNLFQETEPFFIAEFDSEKKGDHPLLYMKKWYEDCETTADGKIVGFSDKSEPEYDLKYTAKVFKKTAENLKVATAEKASEAEFKKTNRTIIYYLNKFIEDKVDKDILIPFKAVFADMVTVYVALLHRYGEGKSKIFPDDIVGKAGEIDSLTAYFTKAEVQRWVDNLDWLIVKLQKMDDIDYKLPHKLRWLSRIGQKVIKDMKQEEEEKKKKEKEEAEKAKKEGDGDGK